MTNFERYKKTLQQEQFIKGMILNCKGCPIPCAECEFIGRDTQSITCEDVLRRWCDEKTDEETYQELNPYPTWILNG